MLIISLIDEIAFEKPLWYFVEVKTKATIQIHPISSNAAARSLSFSGHWWMNAGTSACVSSLYLCAGGSPHPQALLAAVPQLLQLSLAPQAPKQLQQWLSWHAGLSPRVAKVLACALWGSCSVALTNKSCSPSLTLDCAAAKRIPIFLSKSLKLCTMVVTKSWKLLKPLMGSSDKGKNLYNNMITHF